MAINNSLLIHQFKRKDFEYNVTDYIKPDGSYDREKLLADARKVAKANNQRLLRIEKAGLTNAPAYQGAVKALSGVYDKSGAVAYGHVDKAGRPRYKESVAGLSNEELRKMLYAASKTSQAKTATAPGIRKLYEKGAQNLQKMLDKLGPGTKFTVNDLMKLFKDEAFKTMSKQFGYSAVLQAVDEKQKQSGKEPDEIGEEISRLVTKWGDNPNNILELWKRLGLQIPKLGDNWVSSV